LLLGAVSRLNAFVPEWETARRELALRRGAAARPLAKIETLEHEIRQLTLHLARQDGRISEMEVDATRHERERAEYQGQIRQFAGEIEASAARHEKERAGYQTQICQFAAKLQESQSEIEKIREQLVQANQLLHARSISLAQSEARGDDLRNSLCQQLKATRRLLRFLDELDEAAARLRSSRRWQIANPVAALKALLSPAHGSLGYGHLEKIVSAYQKWRTTHPEVTAIDDQIQDPISGAALALRRKQRPARHRQQVFTNLPCQRVRSSFRFTNRSMAQDAQKKCGAADPGVPDLSGEGRAGTLLVCRPVYLDCLLHPAPRLEMEVPPSSP
jgi:hypothetical protein